MRSEISPFQTDFIHKWHISTANNSFHEKKLVTGYIHTTHCVDLSEVIWKVKDALLRQLKTCPAQFSCQCLELLHIFGQSSCQCSEILHIFGQFSCQCLELLHIFAQFSSQCLEIIHNIRTIIFPILTASPHTRANFVTMLKMSPHTRPIFLTMFCEI